jgi:hypothetical protein
MNYQRRRGETDIDREYRELLIQFTLGDIIKANNTITPKYSFACPFCSQFRKKEWKKKAKCSALFWVESRNCFKFQCFNKGCQYEIPVEFPEFLRRLNPGLFREYQMKRYHAGTTGGRWNCPHPPAIEELKSGRTKKFKDSEGAQEPHH